MVSISGANQPLSSCRPHPNNDRGNCWASPGSSAYIGVKLNATTGLSHITVAHIPFDPFNPGLPPVSAPRELRLWALLPPHANASSSPVQPSHPLGLAFDHFTKLYQHCGSLPSYASNTTFSKGRLSKTFTWIQDTEIIIHRWSSSRFWAIGDPNLIPVYITFKYSARAQMCMSIRYMAVVLFI